MAFLPVSPYLPPPNYWDQQDFQAATRQSHLSREKPGLLLEDEEG